MSLGTGRPVILRDETSVKHCRILLSHPMVSPTDVRLVSLVELIAQKSEERFRTSQNDILMNVEFSPDLRDPFTFQRTGEQQYDGLGPASQRRPREMVGGVRRSPS